MRIIRFRDILEAVLPDILHDVGESFLEFVEIFLIEENLVFVIGEAAVPFLPPLALSNGEIVVVVALGGLDIKEVRALASPDRLRKNILGRTLLTIGPVVIVSVHFQKIYFLFRVAKYKKFPNEYYLCRKYFRK